MSHRRAKVVVSLQKRDGDRCWFCGGRLRQDITIEHLIPLSAGGSSEQWNLALAHGRCNNLSGSVRFTEKLVLRDRLRAGWPASKATLDGNLRTRRRNRRYVKLARQPGVLTVSLLTLTKARACGCCGRITTKTIQEKNHPDPKCANCSTWAGEIIARRAP